MLFNAQAYWLLCNMWQGQRGEAAVLTREPWQNWLHAHYRALNASFKALL